MPEIVTRLAPGTPLRDGLERIQRGRTGGLIVLGHDADVERICDGGFELDVDFAPTRLRELSKMDGAVVLSTDGARILRANVHLVPDPNLPSAESGTRHRAAERTAAQTGYPVIAVSKSMRTMTLYLGEVRHLIEPSATILARANQALGTLERYKARLDQVCEQLSESEIEDVVTLRDALSAAQRLELVRRLAKEIEQSVLELGADGRQLALQLEDLVGDSAWLRELLVRDYLACEPVMSGAGAGVPADGLVLRRSTLQRENTDCSCADHQHQDMPGAGVPADGSVLRTSTPQRENTDCSCADHRHVYVSEVERAMAGLDMLSDDELLDLTNLAAPLGYPGTIEALDLPMRPRGYRVLTRIPRLRFTHIESLVDSFGSLQGLLAATAGDLQAVDGIGVPRARQIRDGLTRLAEAGADNPFERER
ncbi:DNA integrity scanning diadenylate cyclase DisA [Nocardia amikacinitolerans]|uniref:DNA integrity scanning diadenylate cyclase DisA n=1 Tax=Nocardia amikacinitolerans TaxID=756689 RepID=UPI001FE7DE97|nr:DNA integrity scanning diadenylate cyclase DisA [Nocardia amikacinitolerans]